MIHVNGAIIAEMQTWRNLSRATQCIFSESWAKIVSPGQARPASPTVATTLVETSGHYAEGRLVKFSKVIVVVMAFLHLLHCFVPWFPQQSP